MFKPKSVNELYAEILAADARHWAGVAPETLELMADEMEHSAANRAEWATISAADAEDEDRLIRFPARGCYCGDEAA